MKVTFDPKKCIHCGACDVLTNGVICSPGDKAAFLNPKANLNHKEVQENIKVAANTCPQKAITIEN